MHSFLTRLCCVFLALQLLNGSVDAPDADQFGIKEDLNHNEQESVVEILVEKVFGYGDVIAEYDDGNSGDESSAKKILSFDFFLVPSDLLVNTTPFFTFCNRYDLRPDLYPQHFNRFFSPPPEVWFYA